MPKTRIPSPARSQGAIQTPRCKRSRRNHSVNLPATSNESTGRLTALNENKMNSLVISPRNSRLSVLSDNTEVGEPRRNSWWKKLEENPIDVLEVLEHNEVVESNILDELEFEVLSPEKNNSLDFADSSESESICSIVLPPRKLFGQKENVPQNCKKIDQLVITREPVSKNNEINDKTLKADVKNLFGHGTKRSRPIFPAGLLNISNKTIGDKTKDMQEEPRKQARKLFESRPASKRKNIFDDFTVAETEVKLPEIEPRLFAFQKSVETCASTTSRSVRQSTTPNVTTEIQMDEWKMLPSSTMVENQLEDMLVGLTPVKKARLSKLGSKIGSNIEVDAEPRHVLHKSSDKLCQPSYFGEKIILDEEIQNQDCNNESIINREHIVREADEEVDDDENNYTLTYEDDNKPTESEEIDGADDKEIEKDITLTQETATSNKSQIEEEKSEPKKQNKSIEQNIEDEIENEQNDELNESHEINKDKQKGEQCEENGQEEIGIDQQDENEQSVNEVEDQNDSEDENEDGQNKSQVEASSEENDSEVEEQNDSEIDENNIEDEIEIEQNDELNESHEINKDKQKSEQFDDKAQEEVEIDQQDENEQSVSEVEDQNDSEDENEDEQNKSQDEASSEENDSEVEEQNDPEMDENNIEDEIEIEQNDDLNESHEINKDKQKSEQLDENAQEEVEIDQQDENEQSVSEVEEQNDSEDENEDEQNKSHVEASSEENDSEVEEQNYSEMKEDNFEKNEIYSSLSEAEDQEIQNDSIDEGRQANEGTKVDSFTARGRNTSTRKTKSPLRPLNISPSLAPIRGTSDGSIDSSAEGSGWDSHRTTRRTIRKTFGKDFTIRKSLRTLVMEKSAKRQTKYNEEITDGAIGPQANSTEFYESYRDAEEVVEASETLEQSNHEESRMLRQKTLETYLQEVKKINAEQRNKIKEYVDKKLAASLEAAEAARIRNQESTSIFKVPPRPKPRKPAKPQSELRKIQRKINLPVEILEDMKYKPPKRFRPRNASWLTKRFYKFLETKLEPRYDYKARVRAEKLAETIYNFTKDLRKHQVAPSDMVHVLKNEMARLDIVRTHFDFHEFFHDFMPTEVRIKVVPDYANKVPLPRDGIFADILS